MSKRRITAGAIAIVAALVVAACGSSSSTTTSGSAGNTGTSSGGSATINGAGSTLAAPIYQQWGSTLKGQGLTVNFNPVGSGAGIAALQSATVQFAGSDPALKSSDKSGMKGPVLQFPVAFGAITVSYHLSGVKSGIKLDGTTISDIYLGKIKSWNDPAIKSLNPGLSLPSTAITVIHRSDSSGTTDGFTKFLAATSPTWKSQVGTGKDVKWPTGTGAAKNAGVAAAVKQTDGGIGYVEQAYALENGFTYAAVKNSAGSYILPTISNTSAAAVGIKIPPDLGISTINSAGPQAYPIVSQTFIDTYKDQCKAGNSAANAAG
ncbi:MAG TPA: phosphate ABC transporter substrate-binding protein PstS, partial [Solirubrobacteraceae bacterium]